MLKVFDIPGIPEGFGPPASWLEEQTCSFSNIDKTCQTVAVIGVSGFCIHLYPLGPICTP